MNVLPYCSGEWTHCPVQDCGALAEVLPQQTWKRLGYVPQVVRVQCILGHRVTAGRSNLVIDDGVRVVE